ncbi:MAG: hypothetical protein JW720_07125 [Sedimentisphaerales bacterium]|nr:hypothetical protein [Sedimentisphaerales bacterium]
MGHKGPLGPFISRRNQESEDRMRKLSTCLALVFFLGSPANARLSETEDAGQASAPLLSSAVSLDGEDWILAVDPENVGRQQQWQTKPLENAKQTKVPWIIQDAFPGYHGVAWYRRRFAPPDNPHRSGRYLLRFWAVDYKADVWLNGDYLGTHEGGESPFVLDATDAVKPKQDNLLSVRVLNPTHQPIDGIVLNETPHRNKALPYTAGSAWNQGGIMDSVELIIAPPLRIEDLFAMPDWKTGDIRILATVRNTLPRTVQAGLDLAVAPSASGPTIRNISLLRKLPTGKSTLETTVHLDNPRLWQLNDPFLYRITASLRAEDSGSLDEYSIRCGFRDFRFDRGAFRLNGKRIYLRCSHTGNCCPVGLEMPLDTDILRRDLINAKAMGFNAIRFIAGVPKRYQLDLCDEIGLMVYEESYAAWCLADSPQMTRRYDDSVLGMIRRDRNHPSVVIWGLLNETPDGAVFRHALAFLPTLRENDDSRVVLLNSGAWHTNSGNIAGIEAWRNRDRVDPCVTRNSTDHTIKALGITWASGQLSFHPGRNGEYSVVRWTAPNDDNIKIEALFSSIARRATTDVHVNHNTGSLFDGLINVGSAGPQAEFNGSTEVAKGDTIDCAVGYGNGDYGADTTALHLLITSASGKIHDAAADLSVRSNPAGPWSYGWLAPAPKPDPKTFTPYPLSVKEEAVGSISNPGSNRWQDLLTDIHPYQRVPHTAAVINTLRTVGDGKPVFLSEYGIGSAIDLVRTVRQYEQLGKADAQDAVLYRQWRDLFLADYDRWKMDMIFAGPEDFLAKSVARMAAQRLLGLNAIRANPNVIGYSITGTVDQGMTGEGLWTTFRRPKPGTSDAVFDGWAPLRWSLFVEPPNAYARTPLKFEAVLANEDALSPGDYPVRLRVTGPDASRLFERTVTISIPDPKAAPEPSMVLPVFAEEIAIDGPPGKYRFTAAFERGAAAAGGDAEFYLADPARMPPVAGEVVLLGDDPELARWLAAREIKTRPWSDQSPPARELILVSGAAGGKAVFIELAGRIASGSTAVFLTTAAFAENGDATALVPLVRKGALAVIPNWLYHKDEWTRRHPIFAGLPCGGLMDYTFYREIIPDAVWSSLPEPAEAVAGAINASQGYSAGLMIAVYDLGAGRFILNTMRIRENLGPNPVAERLLRNILNYAAPQPDAPPAEITPNFDDNLKALGYTK